MATLFNSFLKFSVCLNRTATQLFQNTKYIVKCDQPTRSHWPDWRMMKDNRRRKCLVEHAPDKLRMKALKKNDILPVEIRDIGHKMMDELPRDSSIVRIRNRCAVTSRPRGVVTRWRLSRIVWRSLADYNKLSGVQRAMW